MYGNKSKASKTFQIALFVLSLGMLVYFCISDNNLVTLLHSLPTLHLFWLIGADAVQTFAKWRYPERIVELATLAVLTRGGELVDAGTIPGSPVVVEGRRIDISSTEIRRRVREGKSIRGFVPDSVEAYIASARLYR